MTVTDRALHAVWNVGVEDITPLANNQTERALSAIWNVGIEQVDVLRRVLYPFWNVGIEQINVLLRVLYPYWNVDADMGPETNLEWVLFDTDFSTVEHILRGK